MSGVISLVLLHVLHRAKEKVTVPVGTWHKSFGSHFVQALVQRPVCLRFAVGDQDCYDGEGVGCLYLIYQL